MRCSATAIDRGEPIWQTRSTVPISMPSSSEAVATTALSSPLFSRCFGLEPQLARKTSVMRQDRILAEPLAPDGAPLVPQAAAC